MIIAIDFDDTITEPSPFPITGKIKERAIEVIKKLKTQHTLILWTCREGKWLEEAVSLLKEKRIEFDYINDCPQKSKKVVADVYIDDRAFGGIIDWDIIEKTFVK